ncbi:hypothetical protein J3458_012694 [Metarhizium acridum]|uniref:uncharacterized protein n=1 Tax=Metarhizium acridum TaxID=92637 RepID=UPI001C6B4910|nr:hypothetical protein J3458_012694 [Metarhizium acridum]
MAFISYTHAGINDMAAIIGDGLKPWMARLGMNGVIGICVALAFITAIYKLVRTLHILRAKQAAGCCQKKKKKLTPTRLPSHGQQRNRNPTPMPKRGESQLYTTRRPIWSLSLWSSSIGRQQSPPSTYPSSRCITSPWVSWLLRQPSNTNRVPAKTMTQPFNKTRPRDSSPSTETTWTGLPFGEISLTKRATQSTDTCPEAKSPWPSYTPTSCETTCPPGTPQCSELAPTGPFSKTRQRVGHSPCNRPRMQTLRFEHWEKQSRRICFLLHETPSGHLCVAFMCCFPSGFDPSEKFGNLLKDIHAPVPSYSKIGASMERFFSKLQVGKSVKRLNWSVQTNDELYALGNHTKDDEAEATSEDSIDANQVTLGRTTCKEYSS